MEDSRSLTSKVEIFGSTLTVKRKIRATPEKLFEAWTNPTHLQKWWGPRPAICNEASIDLRVGGKYRISNQFPDGSIVLIYGEFEVIERPTRIVYTWQIEPRNSEVIERVTVQFVPTSDGTEVVVIHEKVPDKEILKGHESGWISCLSNLDSYASS